MNPNLFRYIWTHSRPEQIRILFAILISLPFYFASFDVPKRIINEAIQGKAFASAEASVRVLQFDISLPAWLGGYSAKLFEGISVGQLGLLWYLSGLFLLLVLINGAFKFYINLSKGILGERMLRRMRYELFSLFLRFRPEDIRAVKPAEAATIIKDEVEPIGGFIGDAFIQPAFLGAQALTAMIFIMVQSFWLGLVALVIVLIQAFVIPALRKELIRLSRDRQIASRKLSGRIGEIVETAPTIHAIGASTFSRAEIGDRLGVLFLIRARLFKRKFAVKYLNNLLAQITPFFFYAIGGYLALTGALSVGQLVAVIAAYRDLPPPIKELIDWDQERADVTVKYQQILTQLPTRLLPENDAPVAELDQALVTNTPIRLQALQITDQRGAVLLEPLTLDIARPSHVALVGPSGSGRDALTKALGRQVSEVRGRIMIGPVPVIGLPDGAASRAIAYVGPDPHIFAGSIGENILFALRRSQPVLSQTALADELTRRIEAVRSGNPAALPSDDWIDLSLAHVSSKPELIDRVCTLLSEVGMGDDIFRLGVLSRLDATRHASLLEHVPEVRRSVGEALKNPANIRLVEQFDPVRFNRNATLGENLLFGQPRGEMLSYAQLGRDPYIKSILEAEALLYPLVTVGQRMAEGLIEIFADLPAGSPLFERFSFIDAEAMPEFERIVEQANQLGVTRLGPNAQAKLVELSLSYNEQRHRMKVLDPGFEERILRTRNSLRTYLPQGYSSEINFYEPDNAMLGATLRDNVLFGRIAYGVANAEARVTTIIKEALATHGLIETVNQMGLDAEAGPGGRLLQPRQRSAVALARALIGRPDTLVLDNALANFSQTDAKALIGRLQAELTGRTLIVTLNDANEAAGFERVLMFEGGRMVEDIPAVPTRTLTEPSRTHEDVKAG
ncbi:MAG: ABC transporter transmembrane domain-containing protein [Bosea sp. (in: a-proteobacteria)]